MDAITLSNQVRSEHFCSQPITNPWHLDEIALTVIQNLLDRGYEYSGLIDPTPTLIEEARELLVKETRKYDLSYKWPKYEFTFRPEATIIISLLSDSLEERLLRLEKWAKTKGYYDNRGSTNTRAA